ncbi:MAG: hypothetical protein L3J43_03885 [Sulfurovum sp.]|nr:hypothetical protein [Sulfurovum sp.]
MKYSIVLVLLSLLLFAKTIDCVVPFDIALKVKPFFEESEAYSKLKMSVQTVADDKAALTSLSLEDNVKFAVVRKDVLWQVAQEKNALSRSYILMSELPLFALLYLVQKEEYFDMDLVSLAHKKVSIGSLGSANNVYLKTLLKKKKLHHRILYKSVPFDASIKALKTGEIDAYFGFLFTEKESSTLHFQTLFSKETVDYFKSKGIFDIDYNGITSPYVLVASKRADDEEIESVIYSLMKKGIFVPVTYGGFGPINRYVLNHVEQVKIALALRYKSNTHKTKEQEYRTKMCREYHYGFLRLLRQKPAWKKKLKRLGNPQERTRLINVFNSILLETEEQKDSCDLKYLKVQIIKFNTLKKTSINLKKK